MKVHHQLRKCSLTRGSSSQTAVSTGWLAHRLSGIDAITLLSIE
jgi:hypothetical protein